MLSGRFTILWHNRGVLADPEGLSFRATQEVLRSVDVPFTADPFKDVSLRRVNAVASWRASMAPQMTRSHDCNPSAPPALPSRRTILTRATIIWLVLICAEILHGIARGMFLVPHVGEFRSNQIGVFTGSIIILTIAVAFVRWIGASHGRDLLAVGLLWLILTLAFEILFGRFVMGATWERLAADYNIAGGGLLPIGMLTLMLSPLVGAKMRSVLGGDYGKWA